ncbi:cupin domain-containing protein [soil metagenome]
MPDIIVMKTAGAGAPEAEEGAPSNDVLLSGEYKTTTWNHFTGDDGRLYCGIWESSPGKVAIDYKEWEFCHFISGKVILTNEEGKSWTLVAGDGFIIPAGFKGTWETVEHVRKHYVILLPKVTAH